MKFIREPVCADHDIINDACLTQSCDVGLIRLNNNECLPYNNTYTVKQLLDHRSNDVSSYQYTIVGVFSNKTALSDSFNPDIVVSNLVGLNMGKDTEPRREYLVIPYTSVECDTIDDLVVQHIVSHFTVVDDARCFLYLATREQYHYHIRHGFLSQYQFRPTYLSAHKVQVSLIELIANLFYV